MLRFHWHQKSSKKGIKHISVFCYLLYILLACTALVYSLLIFNILYKQIRLPWCLQCRVFFPCGPLLSVTTVCRDRQMSLCLGKPALGPNGKSRFASTLLSSGDILEIMAGKPCCSAQSSKRLPFPPSLQVPLDAFHVLFCSSNMLSSAVSVK